MTKETQDITPATLICLVGRYNRSCWVSGIVLLLIAVLLWGMDVYLLFLAFSFFGFTYSFLGIVLCLGGVGIVGFSQQPLFFIVQQSGELPSLSGSIHIQQLSVFTFLLFILCAAPITTCLGFYMLRQRLIPQDHEILLACSLLTYLRKGLNQGETWTAYPRLVSQRQGILLLNELHLVQISRRFGKLHVRIKI